MSRAQQLGAVLAEDATVAVPPMRGPNIHRAGRRRGLTVTTAGAPTTTRQAEVLNPAVIGAPTDARGIIVGTDQMSGSMVAHDPFTAYSAGRITSPNVCVAGMIGVGKSSLIKTLYVERPLLLRGRRVVVIDRKLRGDEGEYAELTREFGVEPFRFDPGDPAGGTTCNPLDGIIRVAGGRAAQRRLLTAFAEHAGSGALTEWHHKALAEAYALTISDFRDGRTPVMADLLARFRRVVDADQFQGLRTATLDLVEESAIAMMLRFERLLGDDLAGMFDGETSGHVTLHPKITTFDLSALPEDGPATPLVMAYANAWLMGMLGRHRLPGQRTNLVVEEGWAMSTGPTGRMVRSNSKLARGKGLSVIGAFHHISDFPAGSDAIAMMQEAQTVHLFRQEHDADIADCVRYFTLEPDNAGILAALPQGDHLLKIGARKEIRVRGNRTAREVRFTETDSAMVARDLDVANG
jgi:hypothetical protein